MSDESVVIARRRTAAEITSILHRHRQSKLSVVDFCQQHHINLGTFHTWKKRYRNKEVLQADGFLQLRVAEAASSLFAEIGAIRLYQPVSPEFLKALLS